VSLIVYLEYAVLECVLRKTESDKEVIVSTRINSMKRLGYYVRYAIDDALSYHFRRYEDCIEWFARQLQDLTYCVKNLVFINVTMETLLQWELKQWEAYRSATRCHMRKPFAPYDSSSAIIAISYRDPAYENCNLNYKNSIYIPITFHNLSSYDAIYN